MAGMRWAAIGFFRWEFYTTKWGSTWCGVVVGWPGDEGRPLVCLDGNIFLQKEQKHTPMYAWPQDASNAHEAFLEMRGAQLGWMATECVVISCATHTSERGWEGRSSLVWCTLT